MRVQCECTELRVQCESTESRECRESRVQSESTESRKYGAIHLNRLFCPRPLQTLLQTRCVAEGDLVGNLWGKEKRNNLSGGSQANKKILVRTVPQGLIR